MWSRSTRRSVCEWDRHCYISGAWRCLARHDASALAFTAFAKAIVTPSHCHHHCSYPLWHSSAASHNIRALYSRRCLHRPPLPIPGRLLGEVASMRLLCCCLTYQSLPQRSLVPGPGLMEIRIWQLACLPFLAQRTRLKPTASFPWVLPACRHRLLVYRDV